MDAASGTARTLRFRAAALHAVRRFFDGRGYLHVETPLRVATPALEDHIDAIPAAGAWLRTSPEFHLKRLLAEGLPRVYEIGSCFRAGEEGRRHLPEFTMVEWYAAGLDYRDMIAETEALVAAILADEAVRAAWERPLAPGVDLRAPWMRLTVGEAYRRHAGWDPVAAFDADRFDLDLVGKVEPALPADRALVLMDYPPAAAALSRCRPGPPPVAERWEWYAGGLELANAFSELTDPAEQRRRFEACAEGRRRRGQEVYPLDEPFLAALERGLPASAGVALGFDRLLMLLTGTRDIGDVRAFVPPVPRG